MAPATGLTPSMRAYTRRVIILMLLYVGFILGTVTLFRTDNPPTGALAVFLAILPALPIIGVIWAIGRLIVETTDEYQRMLFVKQVLIATGLTLAIATVWGFLENFDQVGHLPGFYVAILWFAMSGVGGAIARWRA